MRPPAPAKDRLETQDVDGIRPQPREHVVEKRVVTEVVATGPRGIELDQARVAPKHRALGNLRARTPELLVHGLAIEAEHYPDRHSTSPARAPEDDPGVRRIKPNGSDGTGNMVSHLMPRHLAPAGATAFVDNGHVSGRRRRAPRALASVRRSNGTCGFPAYRFHEDVFA